MRKYTGLILTLVAVTSVISFQNCSGFSSTGGSPVTVSLGGDGSLSTSSINAASVFASLSAAFLSTEAANPLGGLSSSCVNIGACSSNSTAPSDETLTLTNCTTSDATISGSALVSFSNPGCSPGNITLANLESGQSVSQVIGVLPSYTLTRSSGTSYTVSSSDANNYNGQSVGGGISLAYSISLASQSGTLAIPGFTLTGSDGSSVSVSTPSALNIAFSLGSESVSMGGDLQIDDNADQVTLALSANNLSWAIASCLCPTNANLTGTISGTTTGQVTVSFGPNCGDVSMNFAGDTYGGTLTECNP